MATSTIKVPDLFAAADIPAGDDLNNYDQYSLGSKEKQVFRWSPDVVPLHSPTNYGGYTMWVIRAQWGAIQIAVYYNDVSLIFIRSKFSTSAWGGWYKVSMTAV